MRRPASSTTPRSAAASAGDPAAAALLRAGALFPPAAPLPAGEPVDDVGARSYRHAALGGRVVVRLSPEALAPGDDLEMGLLGFGRPQVRAGVARRRRRALGFPGWALVHDRKHARHALDVVKEMKRLARLARSKPGHAHDGFEEIARRLGRTVPRFLPSYFEEVGRIFLEAGNRTYAAQSFGKARAAEKIHALAVDEDERKQAFLDFALAGAISIKALAEYARDLGQAHDARAAYAHFRDLCVRRTLGGMPPWGGMPDDLRRLACAARLDPAAEDRGFLEEVLESPSLARAPREFWTQYREPILALALAAPRVRGLLLNLFPVFGGADARKHHGEWLDLLDACRATEALVAPANEVPAEAAPAGGAAAWFSRLIAQLTSGWRHAGLPNQVFGLVRRMAQRLKADGTVVTLGNRYGWIDLDLCDLALELGVPLEAPLGQSTFRLEGWAVPVEPSPDRLRDPVHVAADPRFAPLLEAAVADSMGNSAFEAAAVGKKGFVAARRAWLEGQLLRAEQHALPEMHAALKAIDSKTSAATLAEFPGTLERLRRVDVAAALARTLRGGLLDELGWPALEETIAALNDAAGTACGGAAPASSPGGRARASSAPEIHGAFPHLVLVRAGRAVALGPQGRTLEHDLRLPKGAELAGLRFAQGQLLVAWRGPDYKVCAYWSERPAESFPLDSFPRWQHLGVAGALLPDGGVMLGGRALHAGDDGYSEQEGVCSDGTTFWVPEWNERRRCLREVDPRTGEKGRFSLPRFFEEFAGAGWVVDAVNSCLLPAPPGLAASPLGVRDGLLGCRVRRAAPTEPPECRADGNVPMEIESIDGRRVSLMCDDYPRFLGLLRLPGDDRPRPVSSSSDSIVIANPEGDQQLAAFEPGAADRAYARGTPLVPPAHFWHYLSVRDEAGSRALRAISDEIARELVACARPEVTAADPSQTRQRIRALLPGVTHERLRDGILGVTLRAADLAVGLEALAAARDPLRAKAAGPSHAPTTRLLDEEVVRALSALGVSRRGWGDDRVGAQTVAVADAFTEPPAAPRLARGSDEERPEGEGEPLPGSACTWEEVTGAAAAVAFLAVSPRAAEADRASILTLLDFCADAPWVKEPTRFRRLALRWPESPAGFLPGDDDWSCLLRVHGGNVYFVRRGEWYRQATAACSALEYAPNGNFKMPPGAELLDEVRLQPGWDTPERIRRFVALARERGAIPHTPEIVQALATRTGLTRAEATLLWAGMPGLDSYTHDFLGKEVRERLGLKLNEAAAARTTLKVLGPSVRAAIFAAAVPEEPEQLWTPLGAGPDDDASPVARMAAAWNQRVGRRVAVPEELLIRVQKELDPPVAADALLRWLVAPSPATPAYRPDVLDLCAVAMAVPWLFIHLPVGDPLRAGLPALLERARSNAADRDLLIGGTGVHFYEEKEPEKARAAFFASLPGTEHTIERKGFRAQVEAVRVKDCGLLVATLEQWSVLLAFRPARIGDGQDPLLRFFARTTTAASCSDLSAVLLLRSPGYDAIAARIRMTPVPAGRFEADPAAAVPDLVAEVGKKLKLGADAAALYLQTLALAAPTVTDVCRWNDWPAPRYRAAAADLAGRKLLVAAKRPRAGREYFLPGGWEALKAPDPPIETWKLPLYGLERDAGGHILRPVKRFLPLRPLHELFAAAWQRVQSGDAPAYEEVS